MPPRKTPSSHQSLFGTTEVAEASVATKTPAIIAYVDGGARGNPGPSGYGVYVTNAQGKMVAELSEYLGHQTNNFAEYNGLLAALDFAVKHGHPRLQVVSDSELMVKQMTGVYKVRSPELKELYDRARTLARKLERFEIRHVLRAQNRDADRLANEAMDKGRGRAAVKPAAPRPEAAREVNGIVRGGVVEFLGEELPEGSMVKIRAK
jgi:ribonuclease HI